MEKLYYHPERKKLSNMPIFVDPNYYESLRYFVKLAEKIQPEIIKGIEAMIPLFSKTEVLHEKIKQDRSFVDDWSIIESCNEHRNSHLIELKNAIINWATKYNLYIENSSNTTFLEIALWAIPDRRDNEKDIAERKAFLERLGAKNVDFDEEWSISEVIYAEGEEEILKERISFDKIFPFVFTPSHVDIYGAFGSSKLKPLAADYEGLLSRYQLNILLAEAKTDEKIEIEDWFWGAGWDSRTATWNEFESVLDDAYKMYKNYIKNVQKHI